MKTTMKEIKKAINALENGGTTSNESIRNIYSLYGAEGKTKLSKRIYNYLNK